MRESTPTAATVRSALPRRSAAAWLALLLAAAAPAAAQSTGQWAEVTAGAAVVMDGKVKLADVRQGERLRVIEARPPWILVAVTVDGAERRGWIQAAQVRLIDAEPQGADPAPPPASAPSARPWVRVVSEQTPIMLGSQQLGVLRRGELRQLLDANGAWRRVAVRRGGRRDVGWVAAQDVEPLDPGAAGPSQAGDEPASITAPRLAIDWSTESVTLTLEPPLAADGEAQLARALPTVAGSAQRPTLMREGDRLSITLEGDNLLDLFAPGTRSLWVGEQTGAERRMHRVDFPAPQLGTVLSVYRYPDFPEGIVVHVPAEGLLPGYVLEYAYGEWPAENGYWPIARTKGALPRLADLRQGDQGVELRVIVPYAAAGFGDAPLGLRVGAADGSISNAIVVRRRPDEVAKPASQIAEAAAAPVDATIEAPAVEWLPVEEALAALRAAGLRETLVHNRSLAPISAAEAAGGTVQRQGVEPGGAVLAGGELVLAVAAADPWGGAPLTSGVEIDDPGRSRPAAIDAADDFGFVDPDGVWPRIPLAADADGGLSDAGGSGGFPGPAGIDLATLDVTTFALHADPGVPIVPHRDERTATLAAMVRLMLDALWARPEWRNLPSDIGRALTAAIAEQELPLRELLALPEPLADGALDPVVDLTLATLAVELPPDARDALRGDARDFVARRPTFSRLDRNNNGVVADDVVAWVLDWLVRRGLYDPAGQTVIADGGPGTLIAIVPPDEPGDDWPPPRWIDEWPPPI
ncbi:MAG TPA: hypothetical protein PJ982_02450, partial [Lacipirellulaceae bacterium]|nr:hypothetical protein [Lacipirellulaceae bacterium]